MLLKEEPSSGWFGFLEALIHLTSDARLHIRFHNKNYVPICETNLPKIYTIQHRTSFMSRSQAITKICGSLHRLRRVCDEPVMRIVSTAELAVVYKTFGYSAGEFCSALTNKLTQKVSEPIWRAMRPVVRAVLP